VYTHAYSGASHYLLRISAATAEKIAAASVELNVSDAIKSHMEATKANDKVWIAMKAAMAPETCPGCNEPHSVCEILVL